MPENIVFSKKKILNQFTTEELILELVTRDGKYLKDFLKILLKVPYYLELIPNLQKILKIIM